MRLLILGLVFSGMAMAVPAQKPSRRATDAQVGEELYTRHCVACHGEKGRGDGPLADSMVADIPDLQRVLDPDRRDELARVLLRGKGAMPGFEASFDKVAAVKLMKYLEDIVGTTGSRRVPAAVELEPVEAPEKDTDIGGDMGGDIPME